MRTRNERWTKKEHKELVKLFKMGKSNTEIGSRINRSYGSVSSKLNALGLNRPYNVKKTWKVYKAPIHKLKKKELVYLLTHVCKDHGVSYINHYGCYLKETGKEKIGFLDIESGGSLTADFGYVFCYCILSLDGKLKCGVIKPKDLKNGKVRDKKVVQKFCDDVKEFTKVVVYYGRDGKWRHDLPFLRTRAAKWGIKNFPKWKELKVQDVYDIIKTKFKLSRSSQMNACRILGINYGQNRVNPNIWQDALTGNKKALDYIFLHNKEDVYDLRSLWKKVIEYKETESTT